MITRLPCETDVRVEEEANQEETPEQTPLMRVPGKGTPSRETDAIRGAIQSRGLNAQVKYSPLPALSHSIVVLFLEKHGKYAERRKLEGSERGKMTNGGLFCERDKVSRRVFDCSKKVGGGRERGE